MSIYATNAIFQACDLNLEILVKRLEHDSMLATERFESNNIKLKQRKCNFLPPAGNNTSKQG